MNNTSQNNKCLPQAVFKTIINIHLCIKFPCVKFLNILKLSSKCFLIGGCIFFTERNYKDVKQWMPLVELLISKYSHRKYFLSVKVLQSMLDPAAVVYKRRLD